MKSRFLDVFFCFLVLCLLQCATQATRFYSDGEQQADDSFKTVAMTIEHVRRFVNISNSPLEELLQAGDQLLTSRAASFSLYDLPRLSKSDDGDTAAALRQTFEDGVMKLALNEGYRTAEEEDAERGPHRDQVRDYEGCRRDYGSIAEPFTDRIQRRVHTNICNDTPSACANPPAGIGQPPADIYKNRTSFALLMFDAMAKLESGLQEGKLHWVGSYEMCYKISPSYTYVNSTYLAQGVPTENRTLNGKYCRLRLTPNKFANSSLPLRVTVGICVPDTCSRNDVRYYIMEDNLVFKALMENVLGVNVTDVYCGQQDFITPEVESEAATAKAFLLAFFIIIFIATVYDAWFRKGCIRSQYSEIPRPEVYVSLTKPFAVVDEHVDDDKKVPKEFIKRLENDKLTVKDRLEIAFVGFSAYSNCRRIFTSRLKPGHFDCLNGIRTLSFAFFILGSTYLYGPVVTEMYCMANLVTKLRTFPLTLGAQAIFNFHFNVDSFLVLSGFLTCYWWLKRFDEVYKKKFSIGIVLRFILHKYWRIAPMYMFSLAYFTATYRFSERSPFFPAQSVDFENCKGGQWWPNLLLLHNLINTDHQCLAWSWYLALWWQLQIFSLVILIPLVVRPLLAYITLAVLYLGHLGLATAISYQTYGDFGAWYHDFLQTPWCRCGPFFIGMALAIVIYRTKASVKVPMWAAIFGWLAALAVILTVTFATFSQFDSRTRWDQGATAIYDTLARTSWALGVSWVIFACINGCGGLANMFLSWKAFMPLSKLVFSALLVHANVMFFWVYSQFTLIYLSDVNINYMFFGHIMVTYLYGFVLIGLLQYPFSMGLERAFSTTNKLKALLAGRNPLHLDSRGVADDDDAKKGVKAGVFASNNAFVPDDDGKKSPGNAYFTPKDNLAGSSIEMQGKGTPVGYVQVHEEERLQK